jgi:hypothetical protein
MPAQLPRLVASLTEAVCGAERGLVHTLVDGDSEH